MGKHSRQKRGLHSVVWQFTKKMNERFVKVENMSYSNDTVLLNFIGVLITSCTASLVDAFASYAVKWVHVC